MGEAFRKGGQVNHRRRRRALEQQTNFTKAAHGHTEHLLLVQAARPEEAEKILPRPSTSFWKFLKKLLASIRWSGFCARASGFVVRSGPQLSFGASLKSDGFV